MSREHIFGRWMTKFIPISKIVKHEIVSVKHEGGLKPLSPEVRRIISGPPTSRRLRVVCAACNNGWMSQLEAKVQDVLGPMLKGTAVELGHNEQQLLSRWIDKTIMIYEFEDPDNAVTTDKQLREFLSRTGPNVTTRVWIGHFTGQSDYPRPRHHTWGVRQDDGTTVLLQRVDTIPMGEVIFYVTNGIAPDYTVEDYPASELPEHLIQIWPLASDFVRWPPPRSIHGLQHRWLADWRRTDLTSEASDWPVHLPKFKVSRDRWKQLIDDDTNGHPKDWPLEPPIPPFPTAG